MIFPLGDHTGFADTESTSRTGSPPFTGTLKTCIAGPSLAVTAIQLPSGDQDGAPRTSSDSATGRAPAPVEDRQYSVERAGRRTEAQSRLPSGDTATAPSMAPSGALHTSVASSPARRHTASAPPRAAR